VGKNKPMNKIFQNIYQMSLWAKLIGEDIWFVYHTRSNGNIIKKGAIKDIELRSTRLKDAEPHRFRVCSEQFIQPVYFYRQQVFSSQEEAEGNINKSVVWFYE